MKTIKTYVTVLLLFMIISCNAHKSIPMTVEQQKQAVLQFAKEERAKYRIPEHTPMYYLQVNKKGCRLNIRINDIPYGLYFTSDDGETELIPINDHLFSSGQQQVSIEVYPRSTEEIINLNTWVNIKVLYLPERDSSLVPNSQILAELTTPEDIGTRKLIFFTDSLTFDAKLPYDFSYILNNARDLTKVPNLEQKVYAAYNKIREEIIDCNLADFFKDSAGTWPTAAMTYLDEDALVEIYQDIVDKYFNPIFYDRQVAKLDNCEMIVCGHGKFVLLMNKDWMANPIRLSFYDNEEEKKSNEGDPWMTELFVGLYMPNDSDRLEVFY